MVGWMDGWMDDGWMDGVDGLITKSLKWGAHSPPSECKHTIEWMGRTEREVGKVGKERRRAEDSEQRIMLMAVEETEVN
ncbi:unnamed protein product [Onchocerca ochengi]|uniref:Uncharacterized protein n=1 Tax=Onchocerca ochengi TaxID=42157 RepID=A0A182EBJ3_ONCOC|nr:unnamed protein product [Onchocerca ochengi]